MWGGGGGGGGRGGWEGRGGREGGGLAVGFQQQSGLKCCVRGTPS